MVLFLTCWLCLLLLLLLVLSCAAPAAALCCCCCRCFCCPRLLVCSWLCRVLRYGNKSCANMLPTLLEALPGRFQAVRVVSR
jgi:hypothetical protein